MRTRRISGDPRNEPPVLLVKWYDVTKWLLDRVDSFPKNQRFVFGQRLADRTLNILEVLVNATYSPRKAELLARANRDIEVLRRLIRMATDRKLLTPRQYEHCCMASPRVAQGGQAYFLLCEDIWAVFVCPHGTGRRGAGARKRRRSLPPSCLLHSARR